MDGKLSIILPDRKDLLRMTRKPMAAAAAKAVAIITKRTTEGRDIDGLPFAPYTPGYEAQKAGSGRGTNPPNLTATGQLLQQLKVKKVEQTTALIGFDPQHRKTRFERVGSAWAQTQGPRKAGRLVGAQGRFATEWVETGKGRKIKGSDQRATWTLKRLPETVLTAKIVRGLSGKRPFFGIRTAAEIKQLVEIFQQVFDAEVREANERAKAKSRTA